MNYDMHVVSYKQLITIRAGQLLWQRIMAPKFFYIYIILNMLLKM